MTLRCRHYDINGEQPASSNGVVVSVIVPVYNVEDYLERCLESIINQTFSNIEIICVDDGSTDRSGELLDKYAETDSRVIVIHKKNGGVSTARNTALACVKGRFVYFIDSDDWIESNAIEEFVSCMKEDVDVVVAGASVEDEGGDTARGIEGLNKKYAPKRSGVFFLDDNLIKDMTVVIWDKLFRYDIIRKAGISFLEGRKFEDTHFTVEYLVHSKKVFFSRKKVYHYVRRLMSQTTSNYNDYSDKLYVFDHLYKRLEAFDLLSKYRNTLSFHYQRYLKQGYEGSPVSMRRDFMKKATALAQHYDVTVLNSDLVSYVKEGKYSRVTPFDKDVVIVLKVVYPDIENSFKTIKSLFAQSYKLPKVILMVKGADNVAQEDLLKKLPKELTNRLDKELFIEFSSTFALPVIKQKFQDYVLITIESDIVYPQKWLRCVVAAYSDNKDAFKCLTFDNPDMLDDEILFKDFAIVDVDSSGTLTILKSKQIIVSVTSYPARIRSVALALETIYEQTRKPDKVILWLAASQFPNRDDDLPKELLKLVFEKGLEIQWCDDDLKPHKKYYYAFQKYPDDLIVTIDDDILYPPHRIENLYLTYLLYPQAVAAARAHLIAISEAGTILPYKLWPQEIDAYVNKPSLQLCATGCGGVLYPTTLFSKVRECLLDKEIIKRSCLYADDLWLKGMELVAGIPLVVAEEFQELRYTPDSQDVGLWHENVDGGNNDRQLLQIEEEIDQLYGSGTFCKKLLDTTIGENLVGAEALSNLIKFYKSRVKKQVNQVKQQYSKYFTLRMDIRNRGDEGCDVLEQEIVPQPLAVRRPQWLSDGITVESIAERMSVAVQCKGDGELEIGLMGRDVRNEDGKRYPVWIDCTYFAVNGEVIFSEPKTVCHDQRYVYRKPVTDGEIVKLDVTWSECRSSNVLDEYRQLQAELKKERTEVITVQKQINTLHKQYEKYSTLRMDIRNKGDEECDVIEQEVIPRPIFVRKPEWLQGGVTVESIAGRMSVAVQCKGDGELEIGLMGRDVRNEDGKRYPVWIDCTYFAVNGNAIFAETKTVCHDKRYVYRKPVVDGEIVKLDVTWSECRSSNVLDEYRQLQAELKSSKNKTNQLQAELKSSNNKTDKLQKANAKTLQDLNETQRKAAKLDKELQNVKNGWSFKIGRMITYIPRVIFKNH